MLITAEKAEIFLENYLINTREVVTDTKGYKCVCRHSCGHTLRLNKILPTQEDALRHCQVAALQDYLQRSPVAKFLVKLGAGSAKIIAANKAADFLFGGSLIGTCYDWLIPGDRSGVCRDGVCRYERQGVDLEGRLLSLEVIEKLVVIGARLLVVECRQSLNITA